MGGREEPGVMASSEEELTSHLLEVGNKLEKPPTSTKELLALLDRVEVYLSRVEQLPSKAIQTALSSTLKALVGCKLLRHADVDVKVAVASCISEITRITAPEVPYDDDQMKEVFQLIVSSFGSLADKSSQSYIKRTSILETVAKVRSCVVMLDLECDELILEMFWHFIKAIRDYHPENVFTCMESIMIRVIEESEEISSDLLFCILETVKKDNKEVTPVARKLMEKVIHTCADKLIPYIKTAVRTMGLSLADYDEVVNHLCLETSAETVGQSEHTDASVVEVMVDASKPLDPSTDTVQPAEEIPVVAVSLVEELPADGRSNLMTSNGNANVEVDTFSISSMMQVSKSSNTEKVAETVTAGPSVAVCNPDRTGVETDTKASEKINSLTIDANLDAEKVDEEKSKTDPKGGKIIKKRGRKPKAKKKKPGPKLAGKSSSAEKHADDLARPYKVSNKVIYSSPQQESSNEAAEHSSPKPLEADDVSSKGVSGETVKSNEKLEECSKSKTVVRSSENHTSLDVKMTISAVSDLEERTTISMVDASEVKATASKVDMPMEKAGAPNDVNLKEDTTILTSDAAQAVPATLVVEPMEEVESSVGKSPNQLSGPSEDTHEVEDDPSKTKDDIRRRGRSLGKATLQKRSAQAAAENDNKEAITSQKSALKSDKDEEDLIDTPQTSTKRKRIEENKDESKHYGEELVGSKVKVWWPADKRYYKGVIESFDSARKKHKVLYADGEVEHLVLNKQRWEAINPGEDSDTESDEETPEVASGKRHRGKEVNEGTSRKRLGRTLSSKSRSASNKPDSKHNDLAKSDSKSRDGSKAGAKARTDSSTKEEKSEVVLKEKGTQSRGKTKDGDSKTSIRGKSDPKASSKPEVEISSIKQRDRRGKATKPVEEAPMRTSARKLKTREPNKSTSGSAASTAKSKGKSRKSDVKAPEKEESEIEEAAEEQTPSPAKASGNSKRKAVVLDRENKSGGAKAGQKRKKKARKH